MTPAEREALEIKTAWGICEKCYPPKCTEPHPCDGCMDNARAALAIIREATLREAAEECKEQMPGEGGEFEEGYRLACEENARNILALIEKPCTDP